MNFTHSLQISRDMCCMMGGSQPSMLSEDSKNSKVLQK